MSAGTRLTGLRAAACATLSLLVPVGVAAAQPAPLSFGSCRPEQVVAHAAGLQCATLVVPFDRGNSAAGTIALAVQRVPASAPRAGVLVLIAGGPGQPAIPAFEDLIAPLAREAALRGFELVSFDQRGTGQSQGLECPDGGSLRGGLSSYMGLCGDGLGATRSFYTSQESVEDLDALREGLGGMPLSLFAVSYGTRVAGMYAREHPQGVARMVLDSTVPTTGPLPLGSERIRALPRMLDEGACAGGACRSFSGDVYGDLVRLVAVLHRHPLRTRIYDAHGRLRTARVTEQAVLGLLAGLDLAPTVRELVPAAIAAAAHGHVAPLARLVDELRPERRGSGLAGAIADRSLAPVFAPGPLAEDPASVEAPVSDRVISLALFAATSCIENELPWRSDSAPSGRAVTLKSWLASLPAGATAPFAPATLVGASGLDVCLGWPATPPAPPSPSGLSATATLILSGYDDLRTPYEQAVTIAASYSHAQLLRVPDVGHSTVSEDRTGCARRAMIGFLTSGQAPASCPGSGEVQALPLPPASLDRVAPAASRSRMSGRVANAAAMTLEDLFGQTGFDGGGLRGGSWTIQRHGYQLRGMIDVPGVALSGTIRARETGGLHALSVTAKLRISGRLRGELTLRGHMLSGRVGGAAVHTRLAAL